MKKETTIIRRFLTKGEAEKYRAKMLRKRIHAKMGEFSPVGSKTIIYAVKILVA